MNVDAILFDLDGTLWDTVSNCTDSWNDAVRKLGVPHRGFVPTDISGCMGLTEDEIRAKLFGDLPRAEGAQLIHEILAAEHSHIARVGGELYPRLAEGLELLSQRYALGLVSNCGPEYLEAFFGYTGLKKLFRDFECHGSTGLSKGQNIALVMKRSGFRSAIYVGDTEGDAKAACENELPFVYAAYGFGRPEKFDHRIERFWDLVEMLG